MYGPVLFTFETTHHALLAEETALSAALAVEVVPAPPAARARCNLALAVGPDEADALERLLHAAQIPTDRYGPAEP